MPECVQLALPAGAASQTTRTYICRTITRKQKKQTQVSCKTRPVISAQNLRLLRLSQGLVALFLLQSCVFWVTFIILLDQQVCHQTQYTKDHVQNERDVDVTPGVIPSDSAARNQSR